jgi:hypothetical protein
MRVTKQASRHDEPHIIQAPQTTTFINNNNNNNNNNK